MLPCKKARIICEREPTAWLLLQDASEGFAQIDLAPRCLCHSNYRILL